MKNITATQLGALILVVIFGGAAAFVVSVQVINGKLSADIFLTIIGVVLGYISHALGVNTGVNAALSMPQGTTIVSSSQPVNVTPINGTGASPIGAGTPASDTVNVQPPA